MKRFFSLILILLICGGAFAQSQRPKVALVLSGGGAKGAAHVGVLKVLEEYDIPIDMVVGSSIGAIVGGLYAQGYSARTLEAMFLNQDWKELLLDGEKEYSGYTFVIPFGGDEKGFRYTAANAGLVEGRRVESLLATLIPSGHDSIDFNKLPIPFACNALDIVSKKEITLRSGDLVQAIRSSMSIPVLFAPVKKGDQVLIDGGMYQNLPVDAALEMGADIVIAVKLGELDIKEKPEINNVGDVTDEWFDLYNRPKLVENIEKADIFIGTTNGNYGSMSYDREAVERLLKNGEEAARSHSEELLLLHKILAEREGKNDGARLRKNFDEPQVPKVVAKTRKPENESVLAIGGYFDSEEIIALRVHLGYKETVGKGLKADLDLKLAYNLQAKAAAIYAINENIQVNGGYKFRNSSTNIFKQAHLVDFAFREHLFFADFSGKWFNDLNARAGVSYQMYERYQYYSNCFDAYLDASYDTRNNRFLPKRGFNVRARGDLYAWYVPAVTLHADGVIPLGETYALIPSFDHRTLFASVGSEVLPYLANCFGGVQAGRYFDQQIAYSGFNHIQFADNSLSILALEGRGIYHDKHCARITASCTYDSPYLFKKAGDQGGRFTYGANLGYSYLTMLGPLSLNLNWSSFTKRVGVYVSAGFNF